MSLTWRNGEPSDGGKSGCSYPQSKNKSPNAQLLFNLRNSDELKTAVNKVNLEKNLVPDLEVVLSLFTGLAEVYKEYKDFEWTYGRQKSS